MSATPVYAPMRLIKVTVAEHFGVTVTDLESPRRSQDSVIPRHVAMYLCRTLTRASFPDIGRQFGHRDHTSIMHAVNSLQGRFDSDPGLLETTQALRDQLAPKILEIKDVNRAAELIGVRMIGAEDVIGDRIARVFIALEDHIRRAPFSVLERLEGLVADLDLKSDTDNAGAARKEAAQ